MNLFKIINNGRGVEPAPAYIKTPQIVIKEPDLKTWMDFEYFPMPEDAQNPGEEEGYEVTDHGYVVVGEGLDRIIVHKWTKLEIVEPGAPEITEGYELIRDYWETTDTQKIHRYVVCRVIDEKPDCDETTQHLADDGWEIDEEAGTKVHKYRVLTIVDTPPELAENQQIMSDRWEEQGGWSWVHIYDVRTIVDNPPEIPEGYSFVEDHWEDDGITRTHIYDEWRKVIDNPPELKEGEQIVDRTFTDDGETREYHYEVRKIVDNPPALAEDQAIIDDHWEDDGTTRTHVYEVRTIVDNPPELAENQYINEEHWDDDGTTRTHVYDVWTRIDKVPDIAENERLEDLDWETDEANKTITHKYNVLTVVDDGPHPPSGQYFTGNKSETREGDVVTIVYEYKDYEPIRVSKLELEDALARKGKLTAFNTFVDGLPEIDYGNGEKVTVRSRYDIANELNTGHPMFKPYLGMACSALDMTETEVMEMLMGCQVK